MNKNEIVARWNGFEVPVADWNFDDYNFLNKSWVKFRDLKFTNNDEEPTMEEIRHLKLCTSIMWSITNKSITEAFDELVKGIEWYESLKK